MYIPLNGVDRMAYNMYKQIGKIREALESKGYKKDVPLNVFCTELMLIFGMRQQKAIEWSHTFEIVKLIKIEDDIVNFIE